jgi:uncharacterized protein (DUF433 family)
MTDWKELITADPEVMVGKPVIAGTRLTVEFIVERLADGWSEEELLQNYPGLTREQIHACIGRSVGGSLNSKVFEIPICPIRQTRIGTFDFRPESVSKDGAL